MGQPRRRTRATLLPVEVGVQETVYLEFLGRFSSCLGRLIAFPLGGFDVSAVGNCWAAAEAARAEIMTEVEKRILNSMV